MPVVQKNPFSAKRKQESKEGGDGSSEVEAVPCGADASVAVAGSVVLRNDRCGEARCYEEERHERKEHLTGGHGGGDLLG